MLQLTFGALNIQISHIIIAIIKGIIINITLSIC